jgi:uncharacterized membrane-anchored protein YhcB (DUF1043 family)
MAVELGFPLALVVVASGVIGIAAGVVFERTRGPAARRAAKFAADLLQARSELMRYQDQTKQHFGKSAELLGRMATDYREFLHHFVSGAEALCGPNLKELSASGLERPLLVGANGSAVHATNGAAPVTVTPAHAAIAPAAMHAAIATTPLRTVTAAAPVPPAAVAPAPLLDPLAEDAVH